MKENTCKYNLEAHREQNMIYNDSIIRFGGSVIIYNLSIILLI